MVKAVGIHYYLPRSPHSHSLDVSVFGVFGFFETDFVFFVFPNNDVKLMVDILFILLLLLLLLILFSSVD